jgi:hypothetical protein
MGNSTSSLNSALVLEDLFPHLTNFNERVAKESESSWIWTYIDKKNNRIGKLLNYNIPTYKKSGIENYYMNRKRMNIHPHIMELL